MFGHQNNQPLQQDHQQAQDNDTSDKPLTSISPSAGQHASSDVAPWQHPGKPLSSIKADDSIAPESDSTSAADDDQTAPTVPADEPAQLPSGGASDDHGSSTDNLIDIKQQALNKLSPLVGHLDQTPEEKFRTTMMMIQASDNQSLVKTAYEAAQEIQDEKTRAQALLDVINEINYFTQHPDK